MRLAENLLECGIPDLFSCQTQPNLTRLPTEGGFSSSFPFLHWAPVRRCGHEFSMVRGMPFERVLEVSCLPFFFEGGYGGLTQLPITGVTLPCLGQRDLFGDQAWSRAPFSGRIGDHSCKTSDLQANCAPFGFLHFCFRIIEASELFVCCGDHLQVGVPL